MSLQEVKTGQLTDGRTTTGRDFVKLPKVPSVTVLFINITGGTATVNIEVSDQPNPDPTNANHFFTIKTVTAKVVERVSLPASVIACNVSAIAGATVNVTYRTIIYDGVPDTAIETFEEGDIRARRIFIDAPITLEAADSDIGAPTRFYGPAQPGTTNGTLYTVPASNVATIKTIHAANTTASDATLTLSLDGSTDATMWLKEFSIPANSTYDWTGELMLDASETIQGLQGTSGAITVTISGNLKDNS